MRKNKVFGIRDMRTIKIYSKQKPDQSLDFFIGEKVNDKMCRVKTTRAIINRIVAMPESNAIESARQLLETAKRMGNPDYYETRTR